MEYLDLEFGVANEDDLAEIVKIEQQSYPFPWSVDAFRNELLKPFSNVRVFRDDSSRVFAYVVYWMLFDECHILNVTVAPALRGQSWGKHLVQSVLAQARLNQAKRAFLEVRVDNAAAIGLYQKLGFFIDHEKANFYDDGTSAYFMIIYF
jgi:ribosomal-protein-alanine N-acetyltransferase